MGKIQGRNSPVFLKVEGKTRQRLKQYLDAVSKANSTSRLL